MKARKTQPNLEAERISPKRSPVLMLVQQESKLSLPIKELQDRIEHLKNMGLVKWAYILHDKDKDKHDKPVAPHYHFTLQFKKRVSVDAVAKRLKESPSQFEIMTKRGRDAKVSANNAFAYLVHRTEKAKGKYQYDPKEVIASFDYPKFIKDIAEQMTPKDILEMLGEGKITKHEAQEQIMAFGAPTLGTYKKKIDDIHSARLDIEYQEWLKEMKTLKEPIKIIWCYGAGGVGKTRYAKDWAVRQGLNYYICSGSNSPFDGLNDLSAKEQEVLIIDELRPKTLKYPDLLQILDPMNFEKVAVARYHNPHIMAKAIFVCTVYNPYQFYLQIPNLDRHIDTFDQLSRRIGLNMEVTTYNINETVPKLKEIVDERTGSKFYTYEYEVVRSYINHYANDRVDTTFTLEELEAYKYNKK